MLLVSHVRIDYLRDIGARFGGKKQYIWRPSDLVLGEEAMDNAVPMGGKKGKDNAYSQGCDVPRTQGGLTKRMQDIRWVVITLQRGSRANSLRGLHLVSYWGFLGTEGSQMAKTKQKNGASPK